MPSLLKTITFVVVLTSLSLAVFPVMAQLKQVDSGKATELGLAADKDLQTSIYRITNGFLALVGVVAAIAIVYGGIRYITSQGNDSETEAAKKIVLFAIIGLIVIGLSAVVVNFVLSSVQGGGG